MKELLFTRYNLNKFIDEHMSSVLDDDRKYNIIWVRDFNILWKMIKNTLRKEAEKILLELL